MMQSLTDPYYLLAFVVTPIIVIALALVLYGLDERAFRRRHRQGPAE